MSFNYEITVQPLAEPADEAMPTPLTFRASNHDDLLQIVERVHSMQVLPPSEVAEFSVGLKLFTEVVLRHRHDPLFSEVWPHMSEFMRRLKSISPVDARKD